jgi:tRNA (guanine-N7-)-methyltransferase
VDISDRTTEYHEWLGLRRRQLREKCASLLAAQSSFVLEIGCGHGHFLTAYAGMYSDRLCIGIDVILDRIERAERKRSRAQLANLHFVRAEARDFMESLPLDARIIEVYILFPDPWPKRRHHKNRLLDRSFLHALAQRAGQGARLYFRTDFEPYYLDVVSVLAAQVEWKVSANNEWPFELPTVFQKRAARFRSLMAVRT